MGATATGPWSLRPDYVNTVPGGMTDFFMTGVFTSPEEAPFVAIHFHAGGLMITRGEFEHVSVPLPASGAMLGVRYCWRVCDADSEVGRRNSVIRVLELSLSFPE